MTVVIGAGVVYLVIATVGPYMEGVIVPCDDLRVCHAEDGKH